MANKKPYPPPKGVNAIGRVAKKRQTVGGLGKSCDGTQDVLAPISTGVEGPQQGGKRKTYSPPDKNAFGALIEV